MPIVNGTSCGKEKRFIKAKEEQSRDGESGRNRLLIVSFRNGKGLFVIRSLSHNTNKWCIDFALS
jgi:hypothetical protein